MPRRVWWRTVMRRSQRPQMARPCSSAIPSRAGPGRQAVPPVNGHLLPTGTPGKRSAEPVGSDVHNDEVSAA